MSASKLIFALSFILLSGFSYSQLTNKSRFKDFSKTIDFPFKEKDDVNQKYPRMRVDGEYPYVNLVQLQGIKLSYVVDYDKTEDQELTTTEKDEDWYIDFIIENTSNKDLYYDNPNDVVAILEVPGERTYYTNQRDQEIEIRGGKCVFYAWMLDKKNGKYLFEKEEEYEYDYLVNRDAESYIESWVQRRFRPLAVSVSIPLSASSTIGNKNDLIAYKETASYSDIVTIQSGNYQSTSINLPKKRVYLTSAFSKIESSYSFAKNGDYIVVFEDNSIRVELKQVDAYGKMEYKVSNLISQDLKLNNNTPFAEITISNSHIEELYIMKKNNFAMQKLGPNMSYSKQFFVHLNPISGEYWMDNEKIVPKKLIQRDYIPTNLKLKKIRGATSVTKATGENANKVSIYLLYPLNSKSKFDLGKFYFEDNQKHLFQKGQVYKVELSRDGTIKWITFDTDYNGFTYPPKKIQKWLGDKPGLLGDRVITINANRGNEYYYVMVGDGYIKLQNVEKNEWVEFLNNPSMTKSKEAEIIKK